MYTPITSALTFAQLSSICYIKLYSSLLISAFLVYEFFIVSIVLLLINLFCFPFLFFLSILFFDQFFFKITTRSSDNSMSVSGSSSPVDRCITASFDSDAAPKGGSLPVMLVRSRLSDCTIADYMSIHADFFNVRLFIAMFASGSNVITYDLRGVKLDTNIGGWGRSWRLV